ncbi:MAG: hypothetical protein QGH40_13175 [bacterium]|jgi:fumarate reductase subunit D|nr:hypothetical protein [bacterium]
MNGYFLLLLKLSVIILILSILPLLLIEDKASAEFVVSQLTAFISAVVVIGSVIALRLVRRGPDDNKETSNNDR